MGAKPRSAPRRQRGPRPPGPSPWLYACLVVLVGGLLWGLTRLSTPTDVALESTVRFADAAPQYRLSADAPWRDVEQDHALQLGEELRTTDGMCTAVVIGGASSVRLYIDTVLKLEASSRAGGELTMRLSAGRAWVDADPAVKVRLVTPADEVTVSGGATEVRVERDRVEALTWRGTATCGGKPLRERRRLALADPTPRDLPRPDAWESWNQRVQSPRLASHPVPPLVATTTVAARPSAEPSKVAQARVPRPRPTATPRSAGRPPYPSGTPTMAAPPPTPSATTPAATVEEEEISVGPNDPIEKQVADMGTQDVMRTLGKLNTDAAMNARVDRLGQRIAAQCPRASLEWTFRVIDSAVPNALTVGYGRVYVTRGFLAMVDDEELAGALGHEIAHACLRHTERLFEQQQEAIGYVRKAQEARRLAVAARNQNDAATFNEQARIFKENLRKATEALQRAQSATDRWDAEYQADRFGMLYVHNAGFRPVGLVDSLEKLRKVAGGSSEAAVAGGSTHPPLNERIEIARKVYASYFPGGR